MSRPIGFLPSIMETNSSDNEDDSPVYCPPYPVCDESFRNSPPPYPLEPMGPSVPSAPTINDLDNKIGLTRTEREEIVEVLLQMKRTVEGQTEIKRKEFLNAQKKLRELLYNAQPRLTDIDRDEFVNMAKGIKQIRNQQQQIRIKEQGIESDYYIQRKLLRQKQLNEFEDAIDNCYCDFWSILFKVLQLTMITLAFGQYNQWDVKNLLVNYQNTSTLLSTIFCSFTIIPTIVLLIFYNLGQTPSLIMYKTECVYCVVCMLAYYCATFIQSWESLNVPLFGLGAMLGYALDIIRIYFRVRNIINSPNNGDSIVPPLKKNINNNLNHPVNHAANFAGEKLLNRDNSGCHCNGSYHPSCSNFTNTSDNNYHGQRYAILQICKE